MTAFYYYTLFFKSLKKILIDFFIVVKEDKLLKTCFDIVCNCRGGSIQVGSPD
jgi:hypothetical protein